MVDDATRAFLDHLHRGGAWRHLWWMPERHSRWAEVGAPLTLPGGSREIYYGVHPTTQIPPTNRRGETVPTEHVRSQTPFIAAVSCLFAEFDAKHFDGGKEAAYAHIESLEPAPSAVVDSGGAGAIAEVLPVVVSVGRTPDRRERQANPDSRTSQARALLLEGAAPMRITEETGLSRQAVYHLRSRMRKEGVLA